MLEDLKDDTECLLETERAVLHVKPHIQYVVLGAPDALDIHGSSVSNHIVKMLLILHQFVSVGLKLQACSQRNSQWTCGMHVMMHLCVCTVAPVCVCVCVCFFVFTLNASGTSLKLKKVTTAKGG